MGTINFQDSDTKHRSSREASSYDLLRSSPPPLRCFSYAGAVKFSRQNASAHLPACLRCPPPLLMVSSRSLLRPFFPSRIRLAKSVRAFLFCSVRIGFSRCIYEFRKSVIGKHFPKFARSFSSRCGPSFFFPPSLRIGSIALFSYVGEHVFVPFDCLRKLRLLEHTPFSSFGTNYLPFFCRARHSPSPIRISPSA